ncbi:uncharacterized protein LOC107841243 [Capsicum annuum]|uniref:uncharacterized protein LOC107841243 n=1 Tax=Capsicum annuum TaxID=4072 RepID=UPI001FB0BE2E|nr:uncharacterized protein LOC107841243 [Capsicum annuum]
MKEEEPVDKYFARTLTIVNKMRVYGGKLDDVDVIEKILQSMSSKCAYVVSSIEESKNINTMSIDELQSSLLVHEQRMAPPPIKEQALKVTTQFDSFSGNGFDRGHGRDRGHGQNMSSNGRGSVSDNDQYSTYDSTFDKSQIEYYHCHKYGHYKSECGTNLYSDKGEREKSNFTKQKEEETLLMAYHVQEKSHSNKWYLDFGYSNHMCGNKSLFSDLDESYKDSVKLGNNSSISIMRKDTVKFKESGKKIKILRTDHGGEFNSNEFTSFCAMNGIRRQLTAAYTPQQNGVSERKNHTILKIVRCMLAT